MQNTEQPALLIFLSKFGRKCNKSKYKAARLSDKPRLNSADKAQSIDTAR